MSTTADRQALEPVIAKRGLYTVGGGPPLVHAIRCRQPDLIAPMLALLLLPDRAVTADDNLALNTSDRTGSNAVHAAIFTEQLTELTAALACVSAIVLKTGLPKEETERETERERWRQSGQRSQRDAECLLQALRSTAEKPSAIHSA
jgi:hypothetical protein